MKCSVCGGERLFEMRILESDVLRTHGSVKQTVKAYACEDCGHIDLYAPAEMISEHQRTIREAEEKKIKIENLNKKIAEVNDDIGKLKEIIADENQTVKAVNQAKKRLNELNAELRNLKSELNRASSTSRFCDIMIDNSIRIDK